VVEDERSPTTQRERRRNVRLALIIAAVALAVYFVLWLKVVL
jgi:hypothetical protein